MSNNMFQKAEAAVYTLKKTDQGYEASRMELEMRKQRGFDEIDLPDVRTIHATAHLSSVGSHILSHLETWNPVPQPITSEDMVWLLDNTAFRNPETGQWQAEFVAAVFSKDTGVELSEVVANLSGKLGIAQGSSEEETLKNRLLPFMRSILPGRIVEIAYGNAAPLVLGPGGPNAISSDVKAVPEAKDGDIISATAKVPVGTDGLLKMETAYAEPDGWGVISDIDDSIKITQTSDPIGILKTTFIDPATPIAGMPELYKFMQGVISKESPWFYLSASPYNLYPFLSEFRQKYYPQGTMILRDASWMNLSGLLSNLTLGVQAYKQDRMEKIHSWLPSRKMICIGDSTQSDPEAYGEIYRKFQGWVRLILIRKVTDIAAIGIEEKNEPKRFEDAFKGVPRSAWHVFETPEECYQLIGDVTKSD